MLKNNSILLFQGDSITDTGRTGSPDPSVSLGEGYPAKIAAKLAERSIKVINRGISTTTLHRSNSMSIRLSTAFRP